MGALAVAILVEEGKIDYQARVTDYWPEFGAEGKQNLTVAQLLSHQAGVCGVSRKLTVPDLYDWDKMVRLLAAQKPFWEPGTRAGYHAVTWGFLSGELVRRTAGKTLGTYFQEKVARPLGADFYIGLPDSEMDRVADMIGPNHARIPFAPAPQPEAPPLYPVALLNPDIRPFRDASSYDWRKAELAAANGQANARGIARIYGALAEGGQIDGIRIIRPGSIAAAVVEEAFESQDPVTGKPMRYARGFMLNAENGYGPNPASFGHAGAGGSVGFADPDAGLGVGYVMNQMQVNPDDEPRALRLIEAVYGCL
jgi:CubicO group peptidase (beta-lactamase class C family)